MNKSAILVAAAMLSLPTAAHAQSMFDSTNPTYPGFYIGAQGGLNWLLNNQSYVMDIGWAAGGKVGYDFVGPRVELEGMYHSNNGNAVVIFPTGYANVRGRIEQVSVMANVLYDFFPGATVTPYIGAGAGVAFVDANIQGCSLCLHDVRLPGHPGRWLQRDASHAHRPGRPLLRHDQSRRLLQPEHHGPAEPELQVRPAGSGPAAAAAAVGRAAVVHGVLRLGPLEPVASRR